MSTGTTEAFRVLVTPKRTLLRTAVLSFVLISVPLFGALYLLGIPRGTWAWVLAAQLVVTAVFVVAALSFRRVFVGLTDEHLVERRGFGRPRRTPVPRVECVVLLDTYRSNAPDTTPQLLALDADDASLLCMRGTFWTSASLERVADGIGAPIDRIVEPLTTKQFLRSYPSAAFWFEKRRWILVTVVVIAVAIALAAVLGLMSLAGIPLEFV